jgi:PAS domain S-box-containing protein
VHTDSATIPILTALTVQFALGILVFQANPRRGSNKCFLVLSSAIVLWLAGLYFGITTSSARVAELSIRIASIAGILILTAFNWLRISITQRRNGLMEIFRASATWTFFALVLIILCATPFFLRGAHVGIHQARGPNLGPIPIYGSGASIYGLYFASAGLIVVINYIRGVKISVGGERAELAFILIGVASTLVSVLLLYLLRSFVDQARLIWFAPFRILLFSLVIAYGIATRRIMEVGVFLRRVTSYFVLTAYLIALYALVWWVVTTALGPILGESSAVGYLIAAIAVAFAMAPARGFSQRLADKLFVGSKGLDFRQTMSQAAAILQSVTTLSDLLRRFASTIGEAVGTDTVTIYLKGKKGEFVHRYGVGPNKPVRLTSPLSTDGPLVHWLNSHREPLILDQLHRIRPTPLVVNVRERLKELNAAAALGIFAREHLVGIMLLGARLSGRIYGSMEQDALQVLCGQLAVAIDNAELFTEVQNAKLYNETLVQNLTTGVVAADTDGKITVFNHEAEVITGLTKINEGRIIDDLPAPLRTSIRTTLATGERQEDREASFQLGDEDVYVRASSAIFRGQEREVLGALMVITDITTLKKMEEQIRRTDRLASLGTLSAGMAHEIKNPLVSIKTFAQLLPERYAESDFRETFSSLIVHEINRIDTLVNQLLRFARPTKPLLRPMHVHAVLEKTLLLVQHRLYQKEIRVTRSWEAETDMIRADSDQLEQVFLNFFLNAMDAMKRGGELNVKTEIRTSDPLISQLSVNGTEAEQALCISIRDTGEGIKPGDIAHVFDPFFTTKDHGTGLGLSVVHGIVQEHGGMIEVESELTKGTIFRIYLPLARDAAEVAAA